MTEITDVKELVLASNNSGKITELKALLPGWHLHALQDIGFVEEIAEPYESFEENALAKAQTVFNFSGKNILSDDSGLCVQALHGAPGVHSAYYGGLPRSDEKNKNRLLADLEGHANRAAYYKAVICLIWEGEVHFFEGICEGWIATAPAGKGGFGYDPLFIPAGYDQSFGQLPPEIKNRLSHRGKAIAATLDFLSKRQ